MGRKLVCCCFLVVLFAGQAMCQEAEKENLWKSSVGFSLVTVSGNTDTQTLSVTGDVSRTDDVSKLEMNLGTVYGKNAGEKTAEYWYGKGKYDSNISEKAYLFGQLNLQGNKLAGYDYRISAYPGVGYNFLEGKHSLAGEVGPGYMYEKRIEEDELSFVSGRLFGKYSFKLSDSSDFSQDAEYLYDFEDSKNYRINTHTALTSKINSFLSLKLGVTLQYVNAPPPDSENTDIFTSTSLVFTF